MPVCWKTGVQFHQTWILACFVHRTPTRRKVKRAFHAQPAKSLGQAAGVQTARRTRMAGPAAAAVSPAARGERRTRAGRRSASSAHSTGTRPAGQRAPSAPREKLQWSGVLFHRGSQELGRFKQAMTPTLLRNASPLWSLAKIAQRISFRTQVQAASHAQMAHFLPRDQRAVQSAQ